MDLERRRCAYGHPYLRSPTSLIPPIICCQEDNIHTPDYYWVAWLNRFSNVHEVAPYNVPTRMIYNVIVSPKGACLPLDFQSLLGRRIELAV